MNLGAVQGSGVIERIDATEPMVELDMPTIEVEEETVTTPA